MFDHVTIRVADRAASERFYSTVLETLGIALSHSGDDFAEWQDFSITEAAHEAERTRRLHIGFVAPSREHVDAFWTIATASGFRDDGAPGPRPQYRDDYYGAFLLDPDGNSAEAVHHGDLRRGGVIDHLWLRVADVAAAHRFYEAVAPHAGLRPEGTAQHALIRGESGSFSLVPGDPPTENVPIAFPAPDDLTVAAFHEAAIAAGYRDNGPPGERPEYHPGYHAAFVLDPEGNNIEVVNHNRPG